MMGATGPMVFVPEPPSKKKSIIATLTGGAVPAPAPAADKPAPPRPGQKFGIAPVTAQKHGLVNRQYLQIIMLIPGC